MLAPALRSQIDDKRPLVSNGFIAALVLAQFGIWVGLLTPIALSIALRAGELAGPAGKAAALGSILAVGAFVSMLVTPVAGMLSDRTVSRWGRRRPWIVGGAVLGGGGLAVAGGANSVLLLGVGWVLCQAGFNAMQAAVMSILPDVVPFAQQGRVSGLLGVTTTAATFVGTWISQFTQGSSMTLMLAPFGLTVLLCGLFTLIFNDRSTPSARARASGVNDLLTPFGSWDFNFAFLSRFLIMVAWAILLSYQFYFLTDHLGFQRLMATGVMVRSTAIIAVATVATSLLGGWLSDVIGRRKPLVFISAALEGAGFIAIAIAHSTDGFLMGVGLAAMGKGFYFGVDLALVASVLPDPETTARDLGIFQIANSLPQSLAPALAPFILALGTQGGGGNYGALYLVGGAFSLLGAFAILPVKGIR